MQDFSLGQGQALAQSHLNSFKGSFVPQKIQPPSPLPLLSKVEMELYPGHSPNTQAVGPESGLQHALAVFPHPPTGNSFKEGATLSSTVSVEKKQRALPLRSGIPFTGEQKQGPLTNAKE